MSPKIFRNVPLTPVDSDIAKSGAYAARAIELASRLYDSSAARLSPILKSRSVSACLTCRRDEARAWLSRAQAIHAAHTDLGEQYRRPLRELPARLLQGQ